MKKNNYVIVRTEWGDWEALYIDGKKRMEDHCLDVEDVLEACGINATIKYIADELLEEDGLPDNLSEVASIGA